MRGEYHALYPHHGEPYQLAMKEAKLEYDVWENTECVQRGITIYSNRHQPDESDEATP
jgi:hypothetical protein